MELKTFDGYLKKHISVPNNLTASSNDPKVMKYQSVMMWRQALSDDYDRNRRIIHKIDDLADKGKSFMVICGFVSQIDHLHQQRVNDMFIGKVTAKTSIIERSDCFGYLENVARGDTRRHSHYGLLVSCQMLMQGFKGIKCDDVICCDVIGQNALSRIMNAIDCKGTWWQIEDYDQRSQKTDSNGKRKFDHYLNGIRKRYCGDNKSNIITLCDVRW